MKSTKSLILGGMLALMTSHSVGAATISGSATFATANDLTVIDTGTTTLEFLDLSATAGLASVTDALASVAGGGFGWATLAEMAELFDAFDLPLPSGAASTWGFGSEAADASSVAAFHNAFGILLTNSAGDFAAGYVDDETADGQTALLNVRALTTSSGNSVFRNQYDAGAGDLGGRNSTTGYFLFREVQIAPVPVPAAGFALLTGLGLLSVAGRRRRVKAET